MKIEQDAARIGGRFSIKRESAGDPVSVDTVEHTASKRSAHDHADHSVAGATEPRPHSKTMIPVGVKTGTNQALEIDLQALLTGRALIQGTSGAGKSGAIRKIVEESFEYVTVMILDPEGEFGNLATHIGALTVLAATTAEDGLRRIATKARNLRISLHIDLSNIDAETRIAKGAAFLSGLMDSPSSDWPNTVLLVIDEAHLISPQASTNSIDARTRKVGVSALTDICSRGRKRGIGTVVATQRITKLASSVLAELHNRFIGQNVFDRDAARAGDLLGLGAFEIERLRTLLPGQFLASGPAITTKSIMFRFDKPITAGPGGAPPLKEPNPVLLAEARSLLDIDNLQEPEQKAYPFSPLRGSEARGLDLFLFQPHAEKAVQVFQALARISPHATSLAELAAHTGWTTEVIANTLDILSFSGAIDVMSRDGERIARLSNRTRPKAVAVSIVNLAG